MALVKFVEQDRRHVAQFRILDQLPQQDPFGDETNARPRRGDVLESDLISDFIAESALSFCCNAGREKSRGESARLENDHLLFAKQTMIEQNLRNLRRFAGASGRLQNQARLTAQRGNNLLLELKDREIRTLHVSSYVASAPICRRLRRESSNRPTAICGACVTKTIVQSIGTALPKLNHVWAEPGIHPNVAEVESRHPQNARSSPRGAPPGFVVHRSLRFDARPMRRAERRWVGNGSNGANRRAMFFRPNLRCGSDVRVAAR